MLNVYWTSRGLYWSADEWMLNFFFSSRRRHTRSLCDWSSDVCSSDLGRGHHPIVRQGFRVRRNIDAPPRGVKAKETGSAAPRAIGAAAGGGAARGDIGAAGRAFDEVFGGQRPRAPRPLAPLHLLAQHTPDRLHPLRITEGDPDDDDERDEKQQLAEAEAEHASV